MLRAAPRKMDLAPRMAALTPPSASADAPPSPRCAGRGTADSLREIHVNMPDRWTVRRKSLMRLSAEQIARIREVVPTRKRGRMPACAFSDRD